MLNIFRSVSRECISWLDVSMIFPWYLGLEIGYPIFRHPTCFQFIWFLCAWHIYIYIYIYLCMTLCISFICIFTNIHACMPACIHTYTYIRTYIRTYIHTYIRTYIHYITDLHLHLHLHLHSYLHSHLHSHLHYITYMLHAYIFDLFISMLLCCLEKSPREVLPESSWQNPVRRLGQS